MRASRARGVVGRWDHSNLRSGPGRCSGRAHARGDAVSPRSRRPIWPSTIGCFRRRTDRRGVRMSTTAIGRDDTLELRLKALRLPSFLEQYLELAERAAAEGWSHVRYLAELVTQEAEDRADRRVTRLLHDAKLPKDKILATLDLNRYAAPAAWARSGGAAGARRVPGRSYQCLPDRSAGHRQIPCHGGTSTCVARSRPSRSLHARGTAGGAVARR